MSDQKYKFLISYYFSNDNGHQGHGYQAFLSERAWDGLYELIYIKESNNV